MSYYKNPLEVGAIKSLIAENEQYLKVIKDQKLAIEARNKVEMATLDILQPERLTPVKKMSVEVATHWTSLNKDERDAAIQMFKWMDKNKGEGLNDVLTIKANVKLVDLGKGEDPIDAVTKAVLEMNRTEEQGLHKTISGLSEYQQGLSAIGQGWDALGIKQDSAVAKMTKLVDLAIQFAKYLEMSGTSTGGTQGGMGIVGTILQGIGLLAGVGSASPGARKKLALALSDGSRKGYL